ncbi:GGDEF domain-containing protein [Aeromonas molluscorum]|uniref:GGDEF domain-containing protein n=1 Tax=Aeromonas molluscorum TaxID=271417 RepID=UPI00058C2212|nr:GGDEF domain-containing protein [Aeromonas molluscorum]
MNRLLPPLSRASRTRFALALACLCYCLSGWLGQTLFSLQPANITLIWLPSGIALIMLLNWGGKALAWIFLGSVLLNLDGMMMEGALLASLLHTAIAALIDTLAPAFALHLLQRFLPLGTCNASDLIKFVLLAGVVPILLSSVLLAWNLVLGHYIPASALPGMVKMFFLADILGIVLMYQIYIGWLEPYSLRVVQLRHIILPLAGLSLFAMLGLGLQCGWLLYLMPPLLIVLAFEVSRFYLGILSSLAMLFIILATAHGLGPFIHLTQEETNTEMMAFVLSSALTIFGVSLQRAQLHRTEQDKQTAEKEASYDPLSGLLNRRAFMPKLAQLDHQGSRYCVAMLDIDNFKSINDKHSHRVGDRVIQILAQIIHNRCRSQDITARIGGEEFALVLIDISPSEIHPLLEEIRSTLANMSIVAEQQTLYCTLSIGWADSASGHDGETLLHHADLALYQAKAAGKNRIVKFAD